VTAPALVDLAQLGDRAERQRHALLGHRPGWRALLLDAVEESPCDGGLRLLALPGNGRPLVDAAGTFGGLVEPTGVAGDRAGNVYVADTSAHVVKRFDPCCGSFDPLPCLGGEGDAPRELREPRGIAVSRDDVLYVVDSGNRRVQLFALEGTTLLAIWGPLGPDGRPVPGPAAAGAWLPWDVALDSRRRAYVSDRANGLIHVFDARGRWLRALDGQAPGNPRLAEPTHLAIDSDDRIYVVQEGRDYVVILSPDGELVGRAGPPQSLVGRFRPGPLAADPDGNLFVADTVTRRLCSYRCPSVPGTPVRFTAGACTIEGPTAGLAFAPDGTPFATAGDAVVRLEGAAAFTTAGRLVARAVDSQIAGCAWHRVVLAGRIPAGDSVRVDTYTSDVERDDADVLDLAEEAWSTGLSWTDPGRERWECLVLSPPGRYLWLRLTLQGSGATTPEIDAAKVYFPRESSIRYLPAVYRATPPESTFLERFLSIFDTTFGTIEGTVDCFPSLLDVDSAPAKPLGRSPERGRPDFLTWLASWFGLAFAGPWSEARRRNVLRHVMRLYRRRGTPRGLRETIQVILGLDPDECAALPMPGILEHFKLRRWLFVGAGRLGDASTLWGKRIVDRLQLGEHSTIGSFEITGVADPLRDPFHQCAHRFTVFVPESVAPDERERRMIEGIVELAKPAHTEGRVEFVAPRFRVGVQATIGMDSAIGRYPAGVTAGAATVGYDAVLQEPPDAPRNPAVQVGRRARLGSTVLGGGPS
jgi:phage tail-like protein